MYRSYKLEPSNGGGDTLEFEWDPAIGSVRGRDADIVRRAAEQAKEAGYLCGHPHPTPYKIRDPLRYARDLAVLLGSTWKLSGDLHAAYPKPPRGGRVPDGAVA